MPFADLLRRITGRPARRSDESDATGEAVAGAHLGGWRPGQPRTHFARTPLLERGFVDAEAADGDVPRVMHLTLMSG